MILSLLSLLLTLAVVGWLVKDQLRAVRPAVPAAATSGADAGARIDVSAPAVNQVQQVRSQVEQSLAKSAAAQASAAGQ